jgi:hypothetical protein
MDLDEVVRSNIQDVLDAVARSSQRQEQQAPPAGTAAAADGQGQPSSSRCVPVMRISTHHRTNCAHNPLSNNTTHLTQLA